MEIPEIPQELKQKVLLAIGGEKRNKDLIKDIEEGGQLACMYLNEDAYNTFSAREIVTAYQDGNIEKIIEEAQRRVACENLLFQWHKLSAEQRKKGRM